MMNDSVDTAVTAYKHECLNADTGVVSVRSWTFQETETLPDSIMCRYCWKTIPLHA